MRVCTVKDHVTIGAENVVVISIWFCPLYLRVYTVASDKLPKVRISVVMTEYLNDDGLYPSPVLFSVDLNEISPEWVAKYQDHGYSLAHHIQVSH